MHTSLISWKEIISLYAKFMMELTIIYTCIYTLHDILSQNSIHIQLSLCGTQIPLNWSNLSPRSLWIGLNALVPITGIEPVCGWHLRSVNYIQTLVEPLIDLPKVFHGFMQTQITESQRKSWVNRSKSNQSSNGTDKYCSCLYHHLRRSSATDNSTEVLLAVRRWQPPTWPVLPWPGSAGHDLSEMNPRVSVT